MNNTNENGIFSSVRRIIAIGDIHGDLKSLIVLLRNANLIDNYNKWIAGKTYIVQIGDILDARARIGTWKGGEEHNVIKFLINLNNQAKKFQGRVIFLIGNHELMNILGDFSYASPTDIKKMGGVKERRKYFEPNGKFIKSYALKAYVSVKIGDWIFCHGGINKKISNIYDIEKLNKIYKKFINNKYNKESMKKIVNLFLGNNGILNYRGYGYINPDCSNLYSTLGNLDGHYMVIGHTIQDKINSKCNKRLWRIDTGMSRVFGIKNIKRIHCLEILNNGQSINII